MILSARSTHRNVRKVALRMRGIQSRGFEADRGPNGFANEHETFICCHCGVCETVPQPGCPCEHCRRFPNMVTLTDSLGFCGKCDRATCIACAKIPACAPLLQKLDDYVNKMAKGY